MESDTNVDPAGTAVSRTTLAASPGPSLFAKMLNWSCVPATAGPGSGRCRATETLTVCAATDEARRTRTTTREDRRTTRMDDDTPVADPRRLYHNDRRRG